MGMNMKRHLKKLINVTLEPFGLEIYRKTIHSRTSLRGSLEHAKNLGFYPSAIIDVGAATGTWDLYETFPKSRKILIEPLEEFEPHLNNVTNKYPNSEYIIAAANKESGNVTINVHPDLVGSSLYLENEDSNVNGSPRIVAAITLDKICRERKLNGPFLIKVDVQGAELDVLMGASHILGNTEYVVLEVSFFQFFTGGPQISDVIIFMKERGFVVYEIFDYQYRLLDGSMSQVDIAFVKESGQFREFHFYAKKHQREVQNKMIIESLNNGVYPTADVAFINFDL
jgi:FkbM family methyltransferase